MDPQDHLDGHLDGLTCAVCEAPVPAASLTLLATRDDLAFARVDCSDCGSATLAFVLGNVVARDHRMESAAISADDVLDMHELLASWHGGLSELLSGAQVRSSDSA
jgi:hypothetical protein